MTYQVLYGDTFVAQFDTYTHAMVLYNYAGYSIRFNVVAMAQIMGENLIDFELTTIECAYIIKAKLGMTI